MSSVRRTVRASLLSAFCAAVTACGTGSDDTQGAVEEAGPERSALRDVLFITMDTTRPELFGVYGHDGGATPNVDALAAQGAVFERHYSTSPMTCPSHASMFTGLVPAEHGLIKNGRVLPAATVTVAEVLGDAGYATAAVVGSRVLEGHFGISQGFDVYEDRITSGDGRRARSAERPASEVVDLAIEILESRNPDQPLFLWVHVFDPHRPFDAPFEESAENVDRFVSWVEPNETFEPKRLAIAWAMYEAEYAATDAQLGRLIEAWDAREGDREDAVLLTADHGEGMGEHDYLKHMLYVYEEQIHVPLVVRASAVLPAGSRHLGTTSMLDMAATLTALSGAATAPFRGHDLTALVADPSAARSDVIAERPPIGSYERSMPDIAAALAAHPDRGRASDELFAFVSERAGVRTKLHWSGEIAPEYYDLDADPAELNNLFDLRPQRAKAFAKRVRTWREALPPTPETDVLTDADTLRMLEELGYR